MTQLASEYGRYGYLRITALLRREGWQVNHKRIERLWRREGLKVPAKQPKRRRLWLHDGSCIRLRPAYRDHVWSYDFVQSRTHNGRAFRMLTLMDEYSRECLAIEVLNSSSVLEKLGELFVERGTPEHLRSDNGSEFTAKVVRESRENSTARRSSRAGRALCRERNTRASPIRQRQRVYGQSRMASSSGCRDALHRTGEPLGEWIYREFQWKAQRRVAEPRDL